MLESFDVLTVILKVSVEVVAGAEAVGDLLRFERSAVFLGLNHFRFEFN